MSTSTAQHWNPTQYAENARFVSDLGMSVLEFLSPQAGERILDLGCGDGALTIKLAKLGCNVVGVDSSPEMIAAAKSLGLDAHVADGQSLSFNQEFDAVFSNAALHWMKNPQSVAAGVWRALKPGGRFVGEFGGHGNVSTIVAAIESKLLASDMSVARPWYFPRPEEYRALLENTGFEVENIESFARPTLLPGDLSGWLETFAQPFMASMSTSERQGFITEVSRELRPMLCDANGNWEIDYVRLQFSARKPGAAT